MDPRLYSGTGPGGKGKLAKGVSEERLTPAVENHAHKVTSTGEVALSFTSCSTRDSRSCDLPGQHSRTGPGEGGMVIGPRG